MKPINLAIIAVLVILFLVAAYFSSVLPTQIAIHWGANGQPNGYGDTIFGIFIIPIIAVIISLLLFFLPRIDPLKKNYPKYESMAGKFALLFAAFMLYVEFTIIASNIGVPFSMNTALAPALGILFIILGIILKDLQRNWFFGIRTPWTLSSNNVWKKTHELGSKLFIASGVITFLGAFVSGTRAIVLIIAPVILAAVISVVYSYFVFKEEKKKR